MKTDGVVQRPTYNNVGVVFSEDFMRLEYYNVIRLKFWMGEHKSLQIIQCAHVYHNVMSFRLSGQAIYNHISISITIPFCK
jgi:hypothetical protein